MLNPMMNPPPLSVKNRDTCWRVDKMSATSPQSHDAGRWGSSKMGPSSWWHCERAAHPSHFLNPSPSPPTQRVDNQPTHPRLEDSPLKR